MTLLILFVAFAQTPTFTVASVKPSQRVAGKDYRGKIVIGPDRLSAKNVSLKDVILAAYHLNRYQVTGGPRWLDADEFDIEARADAPASREQIAAMLQTLLAERFHLALHKEAKDGRAYALVVDKQGPKIHPADSHAGTFQGDMQQLANLVSVQLSIPTIDDPTRPGIATDTVVPVLDKTGLAGVYDLNVNIRPEPGADMFVLWQRILQEQLGLKLESQKGKLDFFVVDHVERVPVVN